MDLIYKIMTCKSSRQFLIHQVELYIEPHRTRLSVRYSIVIKILNEVYRLILKFKDYGSKAY